MAPTVLLTGSADAAAPVAEALRAGGAEVLVAAGAAALAATLNRVRPGSLDCYVQLPIGLESTGDTVVARVLHFLRAGLLTRFELVDAVLPLLSRPGRVVLVSGHAPLGRADPDDRAARLAVLDVLARATRADSADVGTRVHVIEHSRGPAEIARVAFGANDAATPTGRLSYLEARAATEDYQEWRTEVLGLAQIDI